MSVWYLTDTTLTRAFELMEQYADQAMDLADATLVTAAETLGTTKVFSIDRRDFDRYRVKRGHNHVGFQVLPYGRQWAIGNDERLGSDRLQIPNRHVS